jgi:hypothetical protein
VIFEQRGRISVVRGGGSGGNLLDEVTPPSAPAG